MAPHENGEMPTRQQRGVAANCKYAEYHESQLLMTSHMYPSLALEELIVVCC
jgi:hypothetical protein